MIPIHITENGVAKVKAADLLAHPKVRAALGAVRALRVAAGGTK